MSRKEKLFLSLNVIMIVAIYAFPYLKPGLYGNTSDLMYHLLRIESVKDALVSFHYPAHIYERFFNGYGYGSPLFYPDFFLIPAALLRIIGLAPRTTWIVFCLFLVVAVAISCFFSFRFICKNSYFSFVGMNLVLLSEFFIADLIDRVGVSEYIAFFFIPILLASLFDLFENEGKHWYLLTISATGLLLSHTIMTFIGMIVSFVLLVAFFFTYHFTLKKNLKVLFLAVKSVFFSVLLSGFYLFPMTEQFFSDSFKVNTPWAHVSAYTEPLESFFLPVGTFNYIACLGVGIPLLLLLPVRIFCEKSNSHCGDVFLFLGIALFAISSELFPWKYFDNTILNVIQFTYRLYPYAIILSTLGLMMCFSEHFSAIAPRIAVITILVCFFFGIWQNKLAFSYSSENTVNLSVEDIDKASNDVGAGEWLPEALSSSVISLEASKNVVYNEGEINFVKKGPLLHSFEALPSEQEYLLPLIFYKGYSAVIKYNSKVVSVPILEKDGQVDLSLPEGFSGEVTVSYSGTVIQKVSDYISLLGILLFISAIIINIKNTKDIQ